MTAQFFPLERLRLFSADGQVYRAFDHLIASRMGTLLLVPVHLVTGPWHLESGSPAVVDGCPVPWEEVHAVLKYPVTHPLTQPAKWNVDDYIEQLEYLGIDTSACELDAIAPMVNGEAKVLRLVHPCGVRYAVVMS